MLSKRNALLILVLSLLSTNHTSASSRSYSHHQCRMVFSGARTEWHPSGGSLFQDLRENVFHFFGWVKNNGKQDIPEALLAEGMVVGDAHILNIVDVLINGQRKIRVIDKDDSGSGFFLYDFIRVITTAKAQKLAIKPVDLFLAYRQGLLEEKKEKPPFLEKVLKTSKEEEKEAQEKYLKKFVDGKKFEISEENRLIKISEAPEKAQQIFNEDYKQFKKELKSFDVLDVAYRKKDTGGSRHQARFWFLVKNKKDEKQIIEFKLASDPAVSVLKPQDDFEKRQKEIDRVYWKGEEDPLYRALGVNGRNYFMRPKRKSFVDFENPESEKEKENAREYLLHLAYHLGRMVADQNPTNYIQALASEPEKSFALIDRLATEYYDLAQKLHRDN